MKYQLFIIINLIFIQVFFGQNESGKAEIIIDENGKEHRILNFENGKEKQSEYLNLLLECKKKADSLLITHFEHYFLKNKLILNAKNSNWFIKGHRIRIDSLITQKPKEVELTYSYVDNNHIFDIIEIGFDCENIVKITFTNGVPKTSNYEIKIDYDNASKIVKKKKFNKKTEEQLKFSNMGTLSLEYTEEDVYRWEIHKKIKQKIGKQVGSCSSVTIHSKALFINAETGEITIKKNIKSRGNIHWY